MQAISESSLQRILDSLVSMIHSDGTVKWQLAHQIGNTVAKLYVNRRNGAD